MTDDNVKTEPEEVPAPAEEAPATNAVLVLRDTQEDGTITTNVVLLGDVKATEAQTVLELGIANWRDRLGLR